MKKTYTKKSWPFIIAIVTLTIITIVLLTNHVAGYYYSRRHSAIPMDHFRVYYLLIFGGTDVFLFLYWLGSRKTIILDDRGIYGSTSLSSATYTLLYSDIASIKIVNTSSISRYSNDLAGCDSVLEITKIDGSIVVITDYDIDDYDDFVKTLRLKLNKQDS